MKRSLLERLGPRLRPIDPVRHLRALDRDVARRGVELLEAREDVAALVAWLREQPARPPGYITGFRLAVALELSISGHTLDEIARKMDRSRERVRQMIAHAHVLLRSRA